MRVRPLLTNPAPWAGVLVTLVMIYDLSINFPGYRTPATWQAALAAGGVGFQVAAPLICAAAAWSVGPIERWRIRNLLMPVRSPLTLVFASTWPLLAGAALGYGISVALIYGATKPNWGGPEQLLVLLTFAAMVFLALLTGAFVGSHLPTAIAVPVALIGGYAAVAVPLVNDSAGIARGVLGFGLPVSLYSINDQILLGALLAPVALGLAALLATYLGGALTTKVRAVLPALVLVVGILAGGFLVAGASVPPTESRPAAQLECHDATPRVCLWPELGADKSIGALATTLSGRLAASGLAKPTLVTSRPGATAPGTVRWDLSGTDDQTSRTMQFAWGYQDMFACRQKPQTQRQLNDEDRAVFALAVALGADPAKIASAGSSPIFDTSTLSTVSSVYRILNLKDARDGFHEFVAWTKANRSICSN